MKSTLAAFAMACIAGAALAAEPEPSPAPASPTAMASPATAPERLVEEPPPAKAGEPAIKRTVIDDRLSRIEELRVRGQLQKITVDNKGRAPDYEVLPGDGGRDLADGANTSHGAAGKRVWSVLRF